MREERVRMRNRYLELAIGEADDEWKFRAVQVGRGIEITKNERFHGWVSAKALRKWSKRLQRLAREVEEGYK